MFFLDVDDKSHLHQFTGRRCDRHDNLLESDQYQFCDICEKENEILQGKTCPMCDCEKIEIKTVDWDEHYFLCTYCGHESRPVFDLRDLDSANNIWP